LIYLCFHILSGVVFHQAFRYSQHKDTHPLSVAAVNYVMAFFVSVAAYLIVGGGTSTPMIVLGLVNGVIYYVSLPFLLRCYQAAGVGISSAVLFISNITPILVAYLCHDEDITSWQWIAIVLIPPAVFLMRPRESGKREQGWGLKTDLQLLVLFLAGGTMATIHMEVELLTQGQGKTLYNMMLFLAAGAVSAGYAAYARLKVTRFEYGLGSFIGVINICTVGFLLLSLATLSTPVVFATAGASVIGLNVVMAWMLWKERLTKTQAVGISLAIAIVVLANI
jgi:drug/metabolite transporter (DMT)-like permease